MAVGFFFFFYSLNCWTSAAAVVVTLVWSIPVLTKIQTPLTEFSINAGHAGCVNKEKRNGSRMKRPEKGRSLVSAACFMALL